MVKIITCIEVTFTPTFSKHRDVEIPASAGMTRGGRLDKGKQVRQGAKKYSSLLSPLRRQGSPYARS